MKYIDAEKLIVEIERRRDGALERQKNLEKIGQETVLNEMIAFELNRLISFVASLQQEQPEVQNGKFVFPKYLYARSKDNKTIDMSYAPQDMAAVEYIRNDFVEQEQPVEGLEEELEKMWLEWCEDIDYLTYASIARHFAEWGMNQCPLPEDTAIFMKGVAEGKRLMMEEAVAVEVVGEKRDLRLIDFTQRCLFNAERGDWLKIIIVKDEL